MELFNATIELMLRIYETLTIWVAWIFAVTACMVAVVYGVFLWSQCRSLSRSPSRERRIDVTSGNTKPGFGGRRVFAEGISRFILALAIPQEVNLRMDDDHEIETLVQGGPGGARLLRRSLHRHFGAKDRRG